MCYCREHPVSGGLSSNSRRPEDKQNYVLLLKELRHQLDAQTNKKYLLTVAYVNAVDIDYWDVKYFLYFIIELELRVNVLLI